MLIARIVLAVLFGLVFFARVTSDVGASADGYYTTEAPDEEDAEGAGSDEDIRS